MTLSLSFKMVGLGFFFSRLLSIPSYTRDDLAMVEALSAKEKRTHGNCKEGFFVDCIESTGVGARGTANK